MYPTFQRLDFFEVTHLSGKPVKPGDVILFYREGGRQPVVHRIVRAAHGGYITRGDHHTAADPWLVHPEDIIGRVLLIHRGKKTVRLASGRYGQSRLAFQKLLLRIYFRASTCIKPILFSRGSVRPKILAHLAEPWLQPRIVRYNTQAGSITRLVTRKGVVGEYDTQAQRWRIKAHYRLLIDESKYLF